MILRRIQVEGYKTLRNPVELKDLGLGLHIVHGPNETGKSTLVSAIARALFDRYNSQDQEIRALRPWGTELAPRILLELETGGKLYRLEKRFLDEESSSLSEWSGSRFERVADSVRADERVRSFLLGSAARSGATGLGNWGLARLLWMTQLPSRMAPPSLDEPLRQHLLGALGSAVLSEAEQRLIARLDQAYDVFFTAAKGSEKKGSPLFEARERLRKAEEALSIWKAKWVEVSGLNEAAADAQARLRAVEAERQGLEAEAKALGAKAAEEAELERLAQLKEQQLLVVLERWKGLNASLLQVAELERQAAAHEQTQARLQPLLESAQAGIASLEARLEEASKAEAAAAETSLRLAREMAQAAMASDARALLKQERELSALIEQARELERGLQARREEHASRKRPKEQELEEARAASEELARLKQRVLDLGLEIRVEPEDAARGLALRWSTPEGSQELRAGPDGALLRGIDQGELVIPGYGRILVRSGAEDSLKLRERASELERRLSAALDAFGVGSLAELQALRASTAEIEVAGQALRAALASLLQGRFKGVPEAAAELERVRASLAAQLRQAGFEEGADASDQWEARLGAPVDLRELQRGQAQAKLAQERASRDRAVLEAELRSARARAEKARAEFESARQGAELLKSQLQARLSALGGRARIEQEIAASALEKSSLEQEHGALAARLPPREARASSRLEALVRAREAALSRSEQARAEFERASALLTHAQAEGYYSKLAAAEEERALAEEALKRRQAQAQGTRVLRTLAHAKQERLNGNLLGPIEASVTALFARIRGSGGGAGGLGRPAAGFALGADLSQVSVRAPVGDAPLETLSLGTQEQVMLAFRLAFGELLSTRGSAPEPQLVVLDDPLVNADPARRDRALEILSEASTKLQILVLTARPDDYRALSPREYDLAALKS